MKKQHGFTRSMENVILGDINTSTDGIIECVMSDTWWDGDRECIGKGWAEFRRELSDRHAARWLSCYKHAIKMHRKLPIVFFI